MVRQRIPRSETAKALRKMKTQGSETITDGQESDAFRSEGAAGVSQGQKPLILSNVFLAPKERPEV